MSKILEGLNPAQEAAVINFQSPSLIIAGAGSGKTRVLTSRIAYMLEQDIPPHQILALTFTNKAASQMRERLETMIDPHLARSIAMGTFHSIFARIIRENAELLGYPQSFTIFQPSDAKSLIKNIVKELDLSDDRYKPNTILSRISFAKNSLITAGAYAANDSYTSEDREMKIPRFAEIYERYCARCKASGAMDFDDLLLQTNILFRDFPEALAKYQQRFQYILVDEYQDTNYAQYIIIRRLAQHHGRVCVVGDDAQSIYSFRGAKIENILNFRNHFPQAQTFKLEQNYRSTQTIVEAANSLISHNKSKLDKRCFSAGEKGENILITKAFTDRDEAKVVAEMIADRKRYDKASYDEVAILYRTNAQSQAMEQALRQNAIPYRIHKGNSFYENKEIKDMLAYIRLIINPRDDEAFKRIINYPTRGIGSATLERIEEIAKEAKYSLWEAIDKLVEQEPTDAKQRTIIRKVKEFVEMIRELSLQRNTLSLYDFGLLVANRSTILPSLRLANTIEANSAIENIEELLNTMRLFSDQIEAEIISGERLEGETPSIEEWLQSVMLLTDQDSNEEDEQEAKVTLMTVHTSKGLEYDYIYVIGVEQNLFPSQRAMEMGEIEEERRLFYVAITRARKAAALSFCDMRFKWGNMEASRPSPFLAEIDPKYIELSEQMDLKSMSYPSRPSQIRDGCYISPTTARDDSGVRERRNNPIVKHHELEELRKKYDYRQQQNSQNHSQNIQRSTAGMRSMGTRRVTPESDPTAQPTAQSGQLATKYAVGDRIEHNRFGRGRVVTVERWSNGDMLGIDFENVGRKSIIAKLAPIKKIEER